MLPTALRPMIKMVDRFDTEHEDTPGIPQSKVVLSTGSDIYQRIAKEMSTNPKLWKLWNTPRPALLASLSGLSFMCLGPAGLAAQARPAWIREYEERHEKKRPWLCFSCYSNACRISFVHDHPHPGPCLRMPMP